MNILQGDRVKSDRTCEAYCTWQRRQGKIKRFQEMFDLIQTFLFELKKRIYNQKQYCLAKNVITG